MTHIATMAKTQQKKRHTHTIKSMPEKNSFTVWEHPKFERIPSEPVAGKPMFIPGLKLNRMFYHDVVKPLMRKYFPDLKYSAALTGHGSDVLGYDNEQSADHNWGPRSVLFFKYSDFLTWAPRVDEMLRKCLPYTYKGFSTNFSNEDPEAYLKQVPIYINSGDVNHLFSLFSIRGYLKHYLGFDRDDEIGLYEWLTFPEQNLLEVTAGEVFYDGLRELHNMRKLFSYYPNDIWLYALRVQWGKIHLEEQFQARTGDIGDELGSSITASKMVDKIIKMAFLMERKYAPYIKWLGTAFDRLKIGQKLKPILLSIEREKNWQKRQDLITQALILLAHEHNALNITKKIPIKITNFHGRGYKVLDCKPFVQETEKQIRDPKLRNMRYVLGRIDQFIDHSRIGQENYVFRHMQDLIE